MIRVNNSTEIDETRWIPPVELPKQIILIIQRIYRSIVMRKRVIVTLMCILFSGVLSYGADGAIGGL